MPSHISDSISASSGRHSVCPGTWQTRHIRLHTAPAACSMFCLHPMCQYQYQLARFVTNTSVTEAHHLTCRQQTRKSTRSLQHCLNWRQMLPEWPTWRYQLKAGVLSSCGPHTMHRLHLQSTEGPQHQAHAKVPDMKACIAELHLCSYISL